ncbi:D-alanyl-D-alanine carboxypeptidase [Nocardia cerradoensis]|uniref:D-alanyl-D-alanine carboxypeptidase n=1 Tax=Nocardia cerradoensis TaxID=85688 RepID=A0A231HA47_9NOCA|nr:serine hydrolase domain-containing protein [Nocardia cerradoensis]OXR45730.1 D-alanyl-D-alanine carboxypeptidase [Nocardia cerradoensis]
MPVVSVPIRPRLIAAALTGVAVLFVACGCGSSSKPAPASTSPAAATTSPVPAVHPLDEPTLRGIVESVARPASVPGVVAFVRTAAGEVGTSYGTRTFGGGPAVTAADHVRIGSVTKTWTGTVILQQVQEHKLALDDPVSKYRTDVPGGAAITIAQLLDMRSGLYNYSETRELAEAMDADPGRVWQPDELLAMAYAHPPYFAPGQGYHYSNTNTILLGLIAEQLDGKPLEQIMRDRLFGPLGLTQTSFPARTSAAIPDPHPQGYMYGTNVLTMGTPPALPPEMQAEAKAGRLLPGDRTADNPSWAWAAGAGISTVGDLATWAEALSDGKVLDVDMQSKRMGSLQATDPANPPEAPQYGLAIAKFGALYGHTGELPGFNTFAGSDPAHKVTVVVWANLEPTADGNAAASAIAKQIIEHLYGTGTLPAGSATVPPGPTSAATATTPAAATPATPTPLSPTGAPTPTR